MNLKRQVALIATPLIIALLVSPAVFALTDGASLTISGSIVGGLILTSLIASYVLARVLLRRVEADLKEGDAKLEAIESTQAVIEFELDGTILTANDNFLSAMGYSLTDIQGQHHSMFVDPDYRESAEYKEFWSSLRRGDFKTGEFKRFGRGGKEIWIQATYTPIFDPDGKPIKVVKFASDITDTVQAKQDAAYKSAALDVASGAMMMVDRDFIVTYANPATKKLLTENAENFRQFWPEFNPDKIIGSCIDMFHKNPSHQRQILADPSRLPISTDIDVGGFRFALSVNGIFDENGDYVGNTLEWGDVTDARINEGKLDAIDRVQATIEFTLDGKVSAANENFLSAMGYTLDEIQGKHHAIFIDPEEKNTQEYRDFWAALRRGDSQGGTFKRIARDGSDVWIQAIYNPILDSSGKPFKFVKFATDITEEVKARETAERESKEKADAQALVVNSLADGLRKLSDGNLTEAIATPFSEEYEQLRHDFNEAVSRLKETMTSIISTVDGIRHGSTEISTAADDLSRRTENQAATLEQTAAALDEITSTVKQTAEGAYEANSVANNAREEAQRSGEIVENTIEAMKEIEKSSTQISQIIGVIDDIAFQTNLLALNAGVEAARAGDAGRGFAVVAQEVRALAQRSSDAAKEIKTLITASSQHVETGVDRVGRTGETLRDIVSRVESVSSLVSDIAASAKEQSTSLTEVNSAVNKMDQVTQQNASMVEETTAASHSLATDADELMSQVSHFDTGAAAVQTHTRKDPSPERAAESPTVVEQQRRAASFAAGAAQNGSAAVNLDLNMDEEDWTEF